MAAKSTNNGGRGWLPAWRWLKSITLARLRADVVAGIVLAAYMLPSGLGDASLANLPPEAGLYACVFAGLVFWLFCSSRHTVITVTSAISLLVGASLGDVANGDSSRFGVLAAGTALLVALLFFLAWLLRAGALVNFISESVMLGFKCGVALFLASTQLPKLLGLPGAHGNFWQNGGHIFTQLSETNVASLVLGGGALLLLVWGRVRHPHRPLTLLVVVGGIVLAHILDLSTWGVKLLGEVPQGIPELEWPSLHWADFNTLLPLAVACFMLSAVETAAIGRMFAAKQRVHVDPNQEFLALAAANLAAGLGRGFPVSGGLSQSLVNEGSGARTPLSGLVAAGIVLIVVIFCAQLLAALPQPVLAAVVLLAIAGLFRADLVKELWLVDRKEFLVAIVALLGVLGSGLLQGVLIGAAISIVQLLRRVARPHVAMLGRIPGTTRYSDMERNPGNETVSGVMIFRPESQLVYFNAEYVRDYLVAQVAASAPPPRAVVLDLSAAAVVDIHGAHMLAELADEWAARGVRLHAVEARAAVRDRLRLLGMAVKLGGIDRFTSVADAVAAIELTGGSTTRPAGS